MSSCLKTGETVIIGKTESHKEEEFKHPYYLCYVDKEGVIHGWFNDEADSCGVVDGFTKVFVCSSDGKDLPAGDIRVKVICVKKKKGKIISALCMT